VECRELHKDKFFEEREKTGGKGRGFLKRTTFDSGCEKKTFISKTRRTRRIERVPFRQDKEKR